MKVTLSEMGYENVSPQPLYTPNITSIAEALADEMTDYLRSLEGWDKIGGILGTNEQLDDSAKRRKYLVERSRVLARREPLSKQAVRLYRVYSGILKVSFKSNDINALNIFKEKFWENPRNRRVLSSIYRGKQSNRLVVDGELFLALTFEENGEIVIRAIDPLQFEDDAFIHDPEDQENVVFYKRKIPAIMMNGRQIKQEETVYYADVFADDTDIARLRQILPSNANIDPSTQIYFVPFDAFGERGNGILFAVISYVENFKRFLENRATIVEGLSTYIRSITVKGGSRAVNQVASFFRSTLGQSGFFSGIDTNPPDAPGSTWVQNENMTKDEGAPITNAGEAMSDARIFRQPIASGVGITEANLTGDPAIGNLASQVQMEGPMLRTLEEYQQLWEEVFTELWQIVLEYNGIDPDTYVDVDLPRAINVPLTELWTVVSGGVQSNLIPREEGARQLLQAIGSNQVDDLLRQLETERQEKEQKQQELFKQQQQSAADQTRDQFMQQRQAQEHFKHLTEVGGECPFCFSESLYEDHGIHVCRNCTVSFDPKHFAEVIESLDDEDYLEEDFNEDFNEWEDEVVDRSNGYH